MENRNSFSKQEIILLLVKGNQEPLITHALIRMMTRRFELYDFYELLKAIEATDLLVRLDIPTKQMGSYQLTKAGETALKNAIENGLKEKLQLKFPEQKEFIEVFALRSV